MKAFTGTPDCGQSCEEWVYSFFPSERSEDDDDSSRSSSGSPSYTEYYSYFEANNITIPDYCYYDFSDVFAWAPGSAVMDLPDDVGFLFGNASDGFTSVLVQTHYNNPNGDAGKVDSSGVRVYYTEELRSFDMGVSVNSVELYHVLPSRSRCVAQLNHKRYKFSQIAHDADRESSAKRCLLGARMHEHRSRDTAFGVKTAFGLKNGKILCTKKCPFVGW